MRKASLQRWPLIHENEGKHDPCEDLHNHTLGGGTSKLKGPGAGIDLFQEREDQYGQSTTNKGESAWR